MIPRDPMPQRHPGLCAFVPPCLRACLFYFLTAGPFVPASLAAIEVAHLVAADGAGGDAFGAFVAISGDTMVIGAYADDGGRGSAYVFVRSAGIWTQQAKLTASDGAPFFDFFGGSVAVSGDTVVVGAWSDDIGANGDQGSAYVFVKPGGGWSDTTQTAKLTASDGVANDRFGYSVAVSGDTVIVGAYHGDTGPNSFHGSAYVFVKPGGGWSNMTQTAKLTASDGAAGDYFGISVAVSGDTTFVGASNDDIGPNGDQGSAYVFVKPGGGWSDMTQTAKLTAADGAGSAELGSSIAVSGDTVVVGAVLDDVGPNFNQGSAYVFVKPGGGWADTTQTAKLTASDGASLDFFGVSVAISGDTVVVGDRDDIGPNADQGSAYVFVKPGGGWSNMTQTAKLTASDGAVGDWFGYSVAVSGDTVVIGAQFDDIGPNANQGSAYVFTLGVLFVDANAAGANDGTSWANAYLNLQDALAYASTHPDINQIWVANGTYKPDQGVGITPGDRTATFQLLNGVALYGGFAGGETDVSQRQPDVNITILSGDLNGNDGPNFANNTENSYHVVTAINASPIFDGFTITAGNANGGGAGQNQGGGMYIDNGDPTVRSCRFENNEAAFGGAAIVEFTADPRFDGCTFFRNRATPEAGAMAVNGSPILTFCTFIGNTANNGGAFTRYNGSSILIGCRFLGNHAGGDGGAVVNFNPGTAGMMTSCLFSGNTALSRGGAIYTGSLGTVFTATNCTFYQNSAAANGGGIYTDGGTTTLRNSIFWNNSDTGGMDESAQTHVGSGTVTVDYSDVQGGWTGTGSNNINTDPMFVDGNGADNVIGTADDDLRLRPGSLCIDAANTPLLPTDSLDLDGDGNTAERSSLAVDGNPRILNDPLTPDTGAGDPLGTCLGGPNHGLPCDANPDCPAATCNCPLACDGGPNDGIVCVVQADCVPGVCVPDCAGDVVDMGASEFFTDCNDNGLPDVCDLACGPAADPCNVPGCGGSADCNGNNIPDDCDIANCTPRRCVGGANNGNPCTSNANCPGGICVGGGPACDDCNRNGVPDSCDIAAMPSLDTSPVDGVIDRCRFWDDEAGNNLWSTALNWKPNSVPGAGDKANIVGLFNICLNIDASVDLLRLLKGATLSVTNSTTGNLTILTSAGILVEGDQETNAPSSLLVANNHTINASPGLVTIGPDGRYEAASGTGCPAGPATVVDGSAEPAPTIVTGGTSSLSAQTVEILGGTCSCPNQTNGGSMTLTDSMQVCTTGDFVIRGTDIAVCTSGCPAALRGGITPPPKLCVTGGGGSGAAARLATGCDPSTSASIVIGGNLLMQKPFSTVAIAGNCAVAAGQAADSDFTEVLLSGNFVNQLHPASPFNWAVGKLTLKGPGMQTFEAGSPDLGGAAAAFSAASFVMGEVEVVANGNVTFVDLFDNDQAGGGQEAVYIYSLILRTNAHVIVDHCKLYYANKVQEAGATITFINSGQSAQVSAVLPPFPAPAPHSRAKNRYISFTPNNGAMPVAFQVVKLTAPVGTGWVGAPDVNGISQVVAAPVMRVWLEAVIHVGDCEIIPVADYELRATADAGATFSPPLPVSTTGQPSPKYWADTVGAFGNVVAGQWDPPNTVVNVNDYIAALQKFLGLASAPHVTVVDVQGVSSTDPCLNKLGNIADVFLIIKAFQGNTYPFTTNPAACTPCP